MNNVCLVGRLTKDNEVRYSQSATPVAVLRNSIAVNRRFKKQGEADADFINILAFGKTAELIEKSVKKGQQLGIEGRIQTGNYEKDGKKVYTSEVVIENITFIGSKNETTNVVSGTDEQDDLPF